jgi:zinc/manganese transport system permease protein
MDFFSLMTLPFLECLVLVGIHSYLGLHVIRRRVIFVDLALAQIAALGTTVAFLMGLNPHSQGAYVFSLLFTVLGAAVFSLSRARGERVPQEAVIGLVYALAAAAGVLVVYGAPHGAEHIQEILTGSILWVKAPMVWRAAGVYAGVGLFHWTFRARFLRISDDPEQARRDGLRVRLWDFLFYVSFGVVITHSVQTAGVLLVFVFLVAPAILAVMLSSRLWVQLLVGWGLGTAVSLAGLVISYYGDLPSGPTVVCTYGVALLLAALGLYVVRAASRGRAAAFVLVGALALGGSALGLRALGHWMRDTHALAAGPHGHVAHHEHSEKTRSGAPAALVAELDALDLVQKRARVRALTDLSKLKALCPFVHEPGTHVAVGLRIFELDRPEGGPRLVDLLARADLAPLLRDEVHVALKAANGGQGLGFDPWTAPDTTENRAALAAWRRVWADGR